LISKTISWNLALLFSGLLICELVFGSWFFGGGLGYVHVPRDIVLQHDAKTIRPGGGAVRYSRDRWGLRGGHREPSDINILTIGGSTTDELYSDDTETWSARLQERFARAGVPAIVGNAGINGHSTVGHLYSMGSWLSRIPQLKPKIILFYIGINDAVLPTQAGYDAIVAVGTWPRIRRYIINNSALVRLIRIVRGSIRAQSLRVAYHTVSSPLVRQDSYPKIDPSLYRRQLLDYGTRVERLFDLTIEIGALPIFVSQRRGDAFQRNGGLFATDGEAAKNRQIQNLYNHEMLRVCRSLKAICIDLASQIILSETDFFDRIHTTPSGSDKIAGFLFDRLQRVVRDQLLNRKTNPNPGAAKH
jgi:lysophospholipase L1-like esterase